MTWVVPLADIKVPEPDVAAVLECLEQGWLTMGPRTQRFEREVAELCGSPHGVAVSSGTAALHLACRAAGFGPGDEVIVPAMTFVATAHAVRYVGATPVICDVDSVTAPNASLACIEAAVTERTRGVMAVHFAGYAADVVALRAWCDARGLVLIEDAAQAICARVPDGGGATAGTIGHLGCLSFFSKKQLCVGEGGMVLTADPAHEAVVRSLRSHAMTSVTWDRHRGHADSYDITDLGANFRLDEPRAALGLARLPRLHEEIDARRAIARAYRERLAGLPGLTLTWDDAAVEDASHFAFVVLLPDRERRDAFRDTLVAEGIQTTFYPAIHRFTEFRELLGEQSLPVAEEVADRHCALPMSPSMGEEQIAAVCGAVRLALGS